MSVTGGPRYPSEEKSGGAVLVSPRKAEEVGRHCEGEEEEEEPKCGGLWLDCLEEGLFESEAFEDVGEGYAYAGISWERFDFR